MKITGQQELLKTLSKINSDIMPDVIADSLNRMANKVRSEIKDEMARVFDRPTRYTLNSMYVKPAKKGMDRIFSETGFIDYSSKGTPAAKYIKPEVEGGKRNLKGFELRLKAVGILPGGYYTAPGNGAKLNQYGNISPGTIQQILSYFSAQRDHNQNTKRGTGRRQQRNRFVVLNEENGKAGGIWKTGAGNNMVCIMNFIKQPSYKAVLDINKIKDQAFNNNMARYTRDSFSKEIKRAQA